MAETARSQVFPRRSLNLLMKLLKPLWAKALRVFLSQQIFLAEKNPWNPYSMWVSRQSHRVINRLSERLAELLHPVPGQDIRPLSTEGHRTVPYVEQTVILANATEDIRFTSES